MSECSNELDLVYAFLGILPTTAPGLVIPIDYSVTTTQLFIQALDKMEISPFAARSSGAESLRISFGLTWSMITAAMSQNGTHFDVAQCYISEQVPLPEDLAVITEPGPGSSTRDPTFYMRRIGTQYDPPDSSRLSGRFVHCLM